MRHAVNEASKKKVTTRTDKTQTEKKKRVGHRGSDGSDLDSRQAYSM